MGLIVFMVGLVSAYFIPAIIVKSVDIHTHIFDHYLADIIIFLMLLNQRTNSNSKARLPYGDRNGWLQAERPEDDIPQTVATGLAACDESAYPSIHT